MKTNFSKIILIIFLMLPADISAFSVARKWIFLPVDSISEGLTLYDIVLDLKNKNIVLNLDNSILHFFQEYTIDSISPMSSHHYSLNAKLDNQTSVRLSAQSLLSSDKDSIYISARYYYSDNRSDSHNSFYTIDSMSISKKDINGLLYSKPDFGSKRLSFVYLGYIGNLKDKDSEKEKYYNRKHIIELGVCYTKTWSILYGYTLYAANEFAFNSHQFFIGPKIGANVSFLLLMLGNELIYYTDFHNNSLYYKPYLGFGIGPVRMSLGYNIPFQKSNYFEINSGSVEFSLSAPFLEIKKRR